MAAGSQVEKGIWADLVIAAIIIRIARIGEKVLFQRVKIDQWPIFSITAIDKRIITSPTRFIRAVIIPAARDLGFW